MKHSKYRVVHVFYHYYSSQMFSIEQYSKLGMMNDDICELGHDSEGALVMMI